GTFSISDCPWAPWQARHGASFSSRSAAKAGSVPARNAARNRAALPVGAILLRLTAHTGPPRRPVSYVIDCTIIVVGQQHRTILQPLDVGRPPDIVVVDNEAGNERYDRLVRAKRV